MSGRRRLITAAPESNNHDSRVVSFRARHAKVKGAARSCEPAYDGDPGILLSLAKFEHDDPKDDYRHRMTVNGVAFVVLLALIAIGVWLADNVSDQHRTAHALTPFASAWANSPMVRLRKGNRRRP